MYELDFSLVVGRKRQRVLTDSNNASSLTVINTDNARKIDPAPGKRLIRIIGTATNSVHLKAAKELTKNKYFILATLMSTLHVIVSSTS